MNSLPLLSLLVFTPWVGAALLALLRRGSPRTSRLIALAFSLSSLALSVGLLVSFDPTRTSLQFVERQPWITALNVHYHLGLDGLSLVLVLLTSLVTPAALLASWRLERSTRLFSALFLALQGAALGVFLAQDFFHWFIFWELSLVPAFFLIKLWGGAGATRAAYQFVVYTIGGSAFMLMGFAALYAATGTMDFGQLAQLGADGTLGRKLAASGGWWPQAVFLGVLLGLVWPIFPAPLHQAAPVLLCMALAGVVLGAFAAMRQTDLKRMVAYSSLNHLSYCLVALFAIASATGGAKPVNDAAVAALSGTLLQLFNHGLSAAALFHCVGILEARSGGRRGLNDFGGVRSAAPIFSGLCGVALFSSLGLPGLNGFVGEFLIFRGVFGLVPWAAAVACLGLLATALFLLTFWQRVFHGPRAGAAAGEFSDLRGVEYAPLIPLIALMFILGLLPHLLTQLFNPLVTAWAGHLVLP
jgi:NADH-quinone oxidoreductase subunit M